MLRSGRRVFQLGIMDELQRVVIRLQKLASKAKKAKQSAKRPSTRDTAAVREECYRLALRLIKNISRNGDD